MKYARTAISVGYIGLIMLGCVMWGWVYGGEHQANIKILDYYRGMSEQTDRS